TLEATTGSPIIDNRCRRVKCGPRWGSSSRSWFARYSTICAKMLGRRNTMKPKWWLQVNCEEKKSCITRCHLLPPRTSARRGDDPTSKPFVSQEFLGSWQPGLLEPGLRT